MAFFDHPDFDGHEQVVLGHDRASGLRAIIAIHDTRRGPALGGCRTFAYADDTAALRDVLRLSRSMTYKAAMAEVPYGGGKAVIIADPRRDKHAGLFRALGRMIDGLGGRYITAEDAGTTVDDLQDVARETPCVVGVRRRPDIDGNMGTGDPSPATAYGVLIGIRAAVAHHLGADTLTGLRVAVQGLGNVGWKLAARLHAAGAQLWVADTDGERAREAERAFGATAVAPDRIVDVAADVFAPCALGSVIDDVTVDRLKAAVVAGSANNQLDRPEHAEQLRQVGIAYAPDYVINAGGLIDVSYERDALDDPQRVRTHIERIGPTLTQIFRQADREGVPTDRVAARMAEERLEQRPSRVA
ncbi:Glu/Leu/Phe/Val dehydrogenase dimerization domain-containing protein [Aquisalimonas lutea]|uniref:Leu/Phe/Val dehydrogenase n=1 Tax=Aquisalimonas lutea TaxID=1327750 RepID=UPI0025B325D9|nr:Glu/Leu/Phe/Val dehydrogenase dimerization domain-containing protein [Aquisalimonas lutea]MDN3518865.1 Glu/Leu/Phe/Val dehydrogenase dimerization domain-containing protein [Aquisalimonas lutea]